MSVEIQTVVSRTKVNIILINWTSHSFIWVVIVDSLLQIIITTTIITSV